MRDSQRSKVYAAERVVVDQAGISRIYYVDDIKIFIDNFCSKVWFKRRFGLRSIQVKDGRGKRRASGGGNTITMPIWSRNQLFILHEVAHCLAPSGCHHNWEFVKTYLDLVYYVLGEDTYKILREKFKKHRVKYYPKRILSEDVREKLRQNFVQNVLKKEVMYVNGSN